MSDIYLATAIAEIVLSLLLLLRLALGPSVTDRIVALNLMSTQAAMAILLFAAFAHRPFYTDVGLWFASFSYLGAIVWARLLERGLL